MSNTYQFCKIHDFLNYQVDRIRFDTQGLSDNKFRDNLLTESSTYAVITFSP
jgi:hypothetical protein